MAPLELAQQKHTGANEQVLGDTGAELGLQGGGWEGGERPPSPCSGWKCSLAELFTQ